MRAALLAFSLALVSPLGANAQSAPPDIVRLEDGGLVRGVIIELVPAQYVVISLPDGSTRRYEMSAVEYAGPTQAVAPAPAPAPAPPAATANQWNGSARPALAAPSPSRGLDGALQLRLTSDSPGVTLMIQTGMAVAQAGLYSATAFAYERVCTAPCTTEMQPGSYQFAVADARGRQYRVPEPVLLSSDASLEIGIESRRRQRIIRWVTSLGLLGVGGGLLAASFRHKSVGEDSWDTHPNWGLLGAGSVLMAGGYALMFVAIFTHDRGKVHVLPQ